MRNNKFFLSTSLAILIMINISTDLTSAANIAATENLRINDTDRVIVKIEKGNLSALNTNDTLILESVGEDAVLTIEVPEGKSMESFINEIENLEGVENVEPDYIIEMDYIPNDPFVLDQYHHDSIGTWNAWDETKGSEDVLVAVIDGGFDVDHPEITDQIFYSYSTITNNSSGVRNGDHGTHVAGIIGSSIDNGRYGAGVAPETDLLLIDVFGPKTAYTSDVIEGIYYAVNAGADIINLSLGNYNYSSSLDSAIQYAHANGLVIIAAAGNDDTDLRHYPSSLKNVIAVGATDWDDDVTDYSNYGEYQDIVAPGSGIYSTLPDENFDQMTGTSMAAPVVSGVAALLLASEPHLSNIEIEERLFSTARDFHEPGKDIFFGHGLVDAEAALSSGDPQRNTKRISGTDRYSTAVEISMNGWDSSDKVILATGSNFPDALAGGPLAYQEDAPMLLTRTASLSPETKEEILRLGASKVIILGSENAISNNIEEELAKMKLTVERIGGKNRFETAASIADRMDSSEAIVANGLNFPDVLSVSPYAARNGIPILLTRKDKVPTETLAALREVSNTYVIGGMGVVSDSVFKALPNPVRYGGETRYETGYEVAAGLPMGTDGAYIATGQNYPDALAGSVLAAKNDAPILLVKTDSIPTVSKIQLPMYSYFNVLGGKGAVNESVFKALGRK